MPIYGITLKIFFSGTKRPMTLILVCSIGCMSITKFVEMMTQGCPWPILRQGEICSLMLSYGKKGKTMDFFSETIVVYDLNLASDDRSDKKLLLTSKLCPLGAVCSLPWGYVLNHEKNCKKSDFKEIFWNLQQMGEVIRLFCWHQNFVPWGQSAPAPGLYTCIKSWKNCIKSDFKEIFLNLQQMRKVIGPFCWHQNFVPWGLSAPAPGLYTCNKSWKNLYKIRLQRDFFETVNKWVKW